MVLVAGVPSPYRAFLKMTLQDVATRKGVFAQFALVWSIAGVCVTLASSAFCDLQAEVRDASQ